MKDWDELIDKGPEIEEPNRRYKKKGGKKIHIIERRYVGPKKTYLTEMYELFREWHTDRRYATERARDEALAALTRRQGNSYRVYDQWEYRLKPTQEQENAEK